MWPRGCAKNLLVKFSEIFYRENTCSWEDFSRFVSLYLTPSCQLLEPCCSETVFAKQRLVFADFWDDNKNLSQILFEFRIVTSNLRCYLMVVLCLNAPNFARCSVALHKHVVNVVVKSLSTFASCALSTLEPMFLIGWLIPETTKKSVIISHYELIFSFKKFHVSTLGNAKSYQKTNCQNLCITRPPF